MKKSKQKMIEEHNEALQRNWKRLAETADLAVLLQAAAHGAADMTDKDRYLSAIRSVGEILEDRIGDSLSELETLRL